MLAQLKKLLELKSLVTLVLTVLIVYVVIRQTNEGTFTFSPEFVGSIITAVFTYYFTRKKDTPTT